VGTVLLGAVLVAVVLAMLVQHIGFQIILAPSASSNSNSSSNSNASSQPILGVTTTTTTQTFPSTLPTPTGGPPGTAPSPSASPTATPVPATLEVHPTTIQLTTCVAAQTHFTIANSGGEAFSWTATASAPGYSLTPTSGTLGGGEQVVVGVSGILLSGTITIAAPAARNAPQSVTITCQV
jgi:hypothetical protein